MIETTLTTERIENTIMKICDFVDSQETVKLGWKNLSEENLWSELVSCILGSRVRYETARACSMHLFELGLLDVSAMLENPRKIEKAIARELSRNIYPPFKGNQGSKYRYPTSKSNFIVACAAKLYYENKMTIKHILFSSKDGIEARETLMKECKGIGPKQASLFLRNIKYSDDLAILDCHVDRYMKLLQLNDALDLINKQKIHPYLKKENKLRIYALSKKRSLASLDIGIWIVMRVIRKEGFV